MSASLELQKAIRARLVATPAVIALVSAASIFDKNTRPEKFPTIILGEAQTVNEPITLSRSHVRIFADVHIWTNDDSLVDVKTITGTVEKALAAKLSVEGFHVVDWSIRGARYMRDPGAVGHAVLTVEALVNELVSA
jgi:hypothetical protein